jgi:hypothetical protein
VDLSLVVGPALRVSKSGRPSSGLPRLDLFSVVTKVRRDVSWVWGRAKGEDGPVHLVNLLEGQTLGLGNHEPDVNTSEDEHTGEDEQDERSDVGSDLGSKEREQEVPDPWAAGQTSVSRQGLRFSNAEEETMDEQLVAAPRAMALGRTRRGKDSPRYVQGVGCESIKGLQVSGYASERHIVWEATHTPEEREAGDLDDSKRNEDVTSSKVHRGELILGRVQRGEREVANKSSDDGCGDGQRKE